MYIYSHLKYLEAIIFSITWLNDMGLSEDGGYLLNDKPIFWIFHQRLPTRMATSATTFKQQGCGLVLQLKRESNE